MTKYNGYVYVRGYVTVEVDAENEREAIDNAYNNAMEISGLSCADADVLSIEVIQNEMS